MTKMCIILYWCGKIVFIVFLSNIFKFITFSHKKIYFSQNDKTRSCQIQPSGQIFLYRLPGILKPWAAGLTHVLNIWCKPPKKMFGLVNVTNFLSVSIVILVFLWRRIFGIEKSPKCSLLCHTMTFYVLLQVCNSHRARLHGLTFTQFSPVFMPIPFNAERPNSAY